MSLALKPKVTGPKVSYTPNTRKPMIRLKKKVYHRAKRGLHRFTDLVRKGQVTEAYQQSLVLETLVLWARSSVGRASDF